MTLSKTPFRKFRILLIWLFSLFLIYSLIGFLLLPWFAEYQLVKTLQQRLGVEATVEKIQFNPYTFELTVDKLNLIDDQSESLAGLNKLYVNLQPLKLLQLTLRIEDITIDSPKLAFSRYSASENTLNRLANRWAETASENKEDAKPEHASKQSEPLLTLEIGEFNYTNGEISYGDDVPATRFETVLSPINIHLDNFSTQVGQAANNELLIELENNAKLTLNGNMVLSPLQLTGEVDLENFSLQTPYRYLQAQLPVELQQGRLDLQFAYDIDMTETLNIDLNQINVELSQFSIHQPGEPIAIVEGGALTAKNGHFYFPENQLSIDNILVDDFKLAAMLNEEGELNWQQLLASFSKDGAETEPTESELPPLQLNIANLEIHNTALAVEDQRPATSTNLMLMLSANMQNFSLLADQKMPFTTDINLDSGGDINLRGELQLFPTLFVQADMNIAELALLPVKPYLNELAHIELMDGKINSTTHFISNEQEPFAIKGNLTLSDLQLDNELLDEKLLGFDKLLLSTVDFSLSNQKLAISEIIMDGLYNRVLINENGETNVGLLMKQQPEKETVKAETNQSESSKPYEVSLGRVKINDASSHFTDQNLPIVFDANLQALNGEISGFSTSSTQPVDINLEGQVGEFGLVEINGALNPLNITQQSILKLAFSNLDLPSMSPYTVKFAGRQIAEGKGDIVLAYEVFDNALKASNDIRIRDIRLGERVESPGAMDLPLDLAVSLLKNSEGVIALNIPVSGDVNDPKFAMGPVIRGAIGNAIKNIVKAPFRFLGSLIGLDGGDKQIDEISFRAGRSDIAPPEQEKLLKLIEALSQRPQLALQIPAPFDDVADRQTLKATAVEARINSGLEVIDSDQQLSEKRQHVLEGLYRQAGLSPDLQAVKQALVNDAEAEQQADVDVLTYSKTLKNRLIEAEVVSDTQLTQLAQQRQNAVMEFIQKNGQLNAKQLQATDTVATKLNENWLVMKFDLGTI